MCEVLPIVSWSSEVESSAVAEPTTKKCLPPLGNEASSASRVRLVVVLSTTSELVNRASSSLTHPACLTSVHDIQTSRKYRNSRPLSLHMAILGSAQVERFRETITHATLSYGVVPLCILEMAEQLPFVPSEDPAPSAPALCILPPGLRVVGTHVRQADHIRDVQPRLRFQYRVESMDRGFQQFEQLFNRFLIPASPSVFGQTWTTR